MTKWFCRRSDVLMTWLPVLLIASGTMIGCSMKAPIDDGAGTVEAGSDSAVTASAHGAGTAPAEARPEAAPSHLLFNGESLDGWEKADFGGQGDVHVEEGVLVLPQGDPLTGVRWTGPFPTMDYEIELEAQREAGTDFFCGLTFPVGDTCASLILGGWAGETCGISSFEDMDASENETMFYRSFETNRWYAVKLRVTTTKVEAWLDGEQVVDIDTEGRRIGTRPEIDLCRPLGFASYLTAAALRDIRWRPVETETMQED